MKGTVTITLNDYEELKNTQGQSRMVELWQLRAMRARLKLSMDQVAKATGVNKATLSRIELERNCSYQNVKKLYDYYVLLIKNYEQVGDLT